MRIQSSRNWLILVALAAGGLAGIAGPVVAELLNAAPRLPALTDFASPTPRPSATVPPSTSTVIASPSVTAPPVLQPSVTVLPSATWTPLPSATPTLTPIPIPTRMVLVPAGYFHMGSTRGLVSEAPEHPVWLEAYYFDQFEVSNGDYRACVAAGVCHIARHSASFTRQAYRDNPEFAGYPTVGVTWDDAFAYCQWAGKRLPTEAEWEYAASGPEDYTWPWGNTFDPLRSAASARDTQPVDSYPEGVSPFGVYNLAGNVTEWVGDIYILGFYSESPPRNPVGEGTGYFRLFRGGSYGDQSSGDYTTSRRIVKERTYYDIATGFRCAQDAPEAAARQLPAERLALETQFCALYAAYRPDAPCE